MTTEEIRAKLLEFLCQNDNDTLDEEADVPLWVRIGPGQTAGQEDSLDIRIEDGADKKPAARYRLTLTEVSD